MRAIPGAPCGKSPTAEKGMEIAQQVGTMNLRIPSDVVTVSSGSPDLICLSHLRWNFVFQRPQHLMSRYARTRRVFFVEEPLFEDVPEPRVSIEAHDGVLVVVPKLPKAYRPDQTITAQRAVIDKLIAAGGITRFVLWYYTPLALQ